MLAFVVVPISVLTLGLGAIVLDALFVVARARPRCPASTLERLLDGARRRHRAGRDHHARLVGARARRRRLVRPADGPPRPAAGRHGATATDVPGIVFVQLDGLAGSCSAGPALRRRADPRPLAARRHAPARRWETGWSSQTGVSQCGILHGSVVDMPAFRWVDKATGRIVVSNRPESAAAIERAHSDGHGLLAHHGSSYGNLFSGDAERAVLTMSGIARRKEGRFGAGYVGYFSRPQQATRTLLDVVVEIARERRAARLQRRRDVEPRVDRGWDVRPAAGVHDGRQPRRVRAGRAQRRGRGAGRDLRRPARLRRGRPPLRSRAGRHARRAARPRPPDRPHRPLVPLGAAAVPPRRAVRPRPDPGRDVPRSAGETLADARRPALWRRRRRATPTPSTGAPSRPRGCATPGRRRSRPEAAGAAASRPCSGPAASGSSRCPARPAG